MTDQDRKETEFDVTARFYGLPAYAIDRLLKTGLYGHTRSDVVERIISLHVRSNWEGLEALGLSTEEAEKQQYIPVKPEETPEDG